MLNQIRNSTEMTDHGCLDLRWGGRQDEVLQRSRAVQRTEAAQFVQRQQQATVRRPAERAQQAVR